MSAPKVESEVGELERELSMLQTITLIRDVQFLLTD
jgi:hypothetical protein